MMWRNPHKWDSVFPCHVLAVVDETFSPHSKGLRRELSRAVVERLGHSARPRREISREFGERLTRDQSILRRGVQSSRRTIGNSPAMAPASLHGRHRAKKESTPCKQLALSLFRPRHFSMPRPTCGDQTRWLPSPPCHPPPPAHNIRTGGPQRRHGSPLAHIR